ncbi:hypothetical protein Vadar_033217 [Vaccinium darrowii]|uniref:Uncharacterized protein n=1 Tax=Vaccinium darrowii TaxID=229202 RepID=A0ACB7XVA0_9ERIC|nr:hypothetical protein Vadar_033217 [Vaccinium darrowii]
MSKEKKRQLMVRPQYPPICHESQMPPVEAFSEETVVINGVWKVGDLVDWSIDGVQWSGRVAQILGDDRVQIELPPPPIGEGSCYEVSCNDLCPSLDWSPEHGWSVPTSKEGENFHLCARIVRPENRAATGLSKLEIDAMDEGIKDVQPTDASSFDASFSSQISSESSPPTHSKGATERPEENMDLLIGDRAIRKTSSPDSIPCSRVRYTSDETAALPAEENQSFCIGPLMKMRTGGNISLNSMYSDTLIAAASDLEELVNRVKWLKSILEQEVPLSDAGRPQWKFMEHIMASIPK